MDVSLDHNTIVDRISAVLEGIEADYDIEGFWNATRSIYAFERSGIVGEAHISDGHVTVDMRLGVLFGAFKKTIEKRLRERLEEGLS